MSGSYRLALKNAGATPTVLPAHSPEAFAKAYRAARATAPDHPPSALLVWHHEAWWDVSANLPAFWRWLVDTGRATPQRSKEYARDPWEHPELLFEASRQLVRLVEAVHPGTGTL